MELYDDYEWEFANHPPHPAAEQFDRFRKIYESETLRGKMLVTMGYVEDVLSRAIKSYLVDDDPGVLKMFVTRSLGSLSARLNLAYLLGLVDEREFKMIEKMAKIRNEFAHKVFVNEEDERLRNHVRDLAALQNLAQYDESETKDYLGEVWGMTIYSLLTGLMNRPEQAARRRLRYQNLELGAP